MEMTQQKERQELRNDEQTCKSCPKKGPEGGMVGLVENKHPFKSLLVIV